MFAELPCIKMSAVIIAPHLTTLYNRCLTDGHHPTALKYNKVIPLFKPGGKNLLLPVAYAESFRGEAKVSSQSCDVTNQMGSAEGTTILGWSEVMPQKNFAKLHLKIRIFMHSGSKF